MRAPLTRHQQQGVTLIEITLVIVAALVLMGIAASYWGNVQEKTRLTRLVNTVSAINDTVHAQYPGVFAYTGLSLSSLWSALPGDVRGSSATPLNAINTSWGSQISLAPLAGTGGYNTRYEITISSLPTSACNGLLSAVSSNFQSVSVGGVTRKSGTNAPLAPSTIATACAGLGGSDPAQIKLGNG